MNIGDLAGYIFNGFCSVLGCGGDAGFLMIGVGIFVFFAILMATMKISLDGVLVIGTFLVVGISTAGFVPSWAGNLPWIILGILIILIIFRYAGRR